LLIVTVFVEMYNWLNFIDYINTIISQLVTFNPFGVGACLIPKPTGSTCGYSYSG